MVVYEGLGSGLAYIPPDRDINSPGPMTEVPVGEIFHRYL